MRARLVLFACAACLLLIVAGVLVEKSGTDGDPERGGPLAIPNEHAWFPEFDQGDVFTDGMERLFLEGSTPGTLTRVELIGAEGQLELVGVMVAGVDRRIGTWQVTPGFPPRQEFFGELVPAEGATIPTGHQDIELLIGMRVLSSDFVFREGIRVHYQVGDQAYVADLPAALVICPDSLSEDQCDDEWLRQSS